MGVIVDEDLDKNATDDSIVPAFTDWANEPTVKDLKQDFTDANSDHSLQEAKIDTWLDNLNITGKAKHKKIKGKSAVVPKLIRKQAEWRYASLSEPFLSTDDVFNTAPVTFEDKKGAVQNGLVLNNQFNTKIDKVRFFDEYVRTAVDEGTAIVRVGWDFVEEEYIDHVPVMALRPTQDPQVLAMYGQMQEMVQTSPQGMSQFPPEVHQGFQASIESGVPQAMQQVGTKPVKKMRTVKNQPTLEVCNYRNVMVDPTCMGDIEKAGFVIYSFDTSMSELEKAGKYKNLDKVNMDANSPLAAEDNSNIENTSFNFTDKPRKKLRAFEYWGFWDIDNSGIVKPFVATWIGDTMIRMEENPFPDKKLPFVTVQYLPVRRSIYGEPDGELLEDNQLINAATMRGMIDILGRSANGQVGSRKDALDVTNKRKFDLGLDYEYNQGSTPNDAFHMHLFPEIPQSAPMMLQMQNNEAESLTGVKAFNSGIDGRALGDNATGIRSAMDATSKRELGILRRLAEGVKQIGRKMISMNAVFLEEVEIIRVTNEKFVPVRKDDLEGNYDLSLSISTAEADNDKAQELSFMLQTMGNNQDPEVTKMIQVEIAQLRKMPGLAKRIEEYQPQPDPIEQEKRMLENELLKAQIAEAKSGAYENQAGGNLDNAKAETEGSVARKLETEADINDLDFVEQEGGTKQERELEKAGEQAKANIGLKMVEGAIKKNIEKDKPKPATKV